MFIFLSSRIKTKSTAISKKKIEKYIQIRVQLYRKRSNHIECCISTGSFRTFRKGRLKVLHSG